MWSPAVLFAGETARFARLSPQARALSWCMAVFAFAQPVFGIFVAAFILRVTGNDLVKVVAYQLAQLSLVPVGAYLNAALRRVRPAASVYAGALVGEAAAFVLLTSGAPLSFPFVAAIGCVYGLASGFLWSNRNYLSLRSTTDGDRNYFYGLEAFFTTVAGVAVPALVGGFIAAALMPPAWAYRAVALAALALSVAAACALRPVRARGLEPPRMRCRLWATPAWRWFAPAAFLKGALQFYSGILPAMLVVVALNRQEGTLGAVQSLCALLAAAVLYLLGRAAGPSARLAVYGAASLLYAAAAGANAALRSPASALAFLACLAFALPALEFSFSGVQMRTMDRCEADQPGSSYFFLCAFEVAIYLGRLAAALAFFVLEARLPPFAALTVTLAGVGVVQLLAVPVLAAVDRACRAAAP